ncbi:MAG: relaxase/mobilization nuclease domain-containing protein [Eubacteriales bacterium]
MATTRIIPMHHNQGKSILQCLSERIDYAKDGEKTADGELISSYECNPETASSEFALSKREYFTLTGRRQEHDVIAYQIRQSFKPGEITAEEANRIGHEFAERFLKGNHAFIVCTHINRHHIHNHIIWNSTSLDCTRKFRNFWYSTNAVRKLSDLICTEHELSVIENPKPHGLTYDRWLGNHAKTSHREIVRAVIDDILAKKPADFEAFLKLLEEQGFSMKRGKHLTLMHPDFKKAIRLDSLGEGYTEADLRFVLSGEIEHTPKKRRNIPTQKNALLIDIEAKLREGKGGGYERWAKVHNLKQMAQTVNYLREHGLLDYDELKKKSADAAARFNELSEQIKAAEKRMSEIAVLKTHIVNYSKTRDIYAAYCKSGYSKKYLAKHESDILIHKAAKKAFDELGIGKLPTVRSLQNEYAELLTQKKAAYAEYRTARDEMKELLIHKANVEQILGKEPENEEKKNGHERG